ncbi:MAG TPA: lysophospholipid acyltransferase family protein [bacterium]|nr:lysophospholipid acyltransferase family protein [bacterium]
MQIVERVIEEIRTMFPDWEQTVPPQIWPLIEQTARETPLPELEGFLERYLSAGKEWGFHPYAPFARRVLKNVLYIITEQVLSGVGNLERSLDLVRGGTASRLILLTNHLSYADANLLATMFHPMLEVKGFGDDFSVVVGPKVYNERFKTFASLQFNSLLIAQSLAVASGDAALPLKEIARAAKKVMADIEQKVRILLIFPEGARSRSGNLNRFLPGVLKLIGSAGDAVILPAAILGGNHILPINDHSLHYARVEVTVGEPVMLRDLHARFGSGEQAKADIMDHLGRRVALCLPPDRRGVYTPGHDEQ